MHASITRDLKCPFHFEHLKEQSKVALRATTKNLNALTFKRRTAEQVDESMFILAEPTNTRLKFECTVAIPPNNTTVYDQ